MAINEFYTRVANSLGIEVSDGFLKIPNGDESVSYTHNGKPLVLPTRDHIRTLLDEDENGEIVVMKHLFNPLDETVIKGDSVSLTKMKSLVETRLAHVTVTVGALLLTIAENPAQQTKSPMIITKFLKRLSEVKGPGIKQVVDDKTISNWIKMYTTALDKGAGKFVKVYSKKGGMLGTKKYNRVSTVQYALYVELSKMEKGGKLLGATLRNKDIPVYKILLEYLAPGLNEAGIVTEGSNDKESPAFISLMSTYLRIMGNLQNIRKRIHGVDEAWEDESCMELSVDLDELDSLKIYKKDLSRIPREGDVSKSKLTKTDHVIRRPVIEDNGTDPAPVYQQQVAERPTDASTDAIHKALYGNRSGINTPIMQNQPMGPQYQQPMQQPMHAPMQQPQYQQPMQQPMQQHMPMHPQMTNASGFAGQQPSIGTLGDVGAFGGGVSVANQQPYQPAGYWNR